MASAGLLFVLDFVFMKPARCVSLPWFYAIKSECNVALMEWRQIEGLALVPMFQKYISSLFKESETSFFSCFLRLISTKAPLFFPLLSSSHAGDHEPFWPGFLKGMLPLVYPSRKCTFVKLMANAAFYLLPEPGVLKLSCIYRYYASSLLYTEAVWAGYFRIKTILNYVF